MEETEEGQRRPSKRVSDLEGIDEDDYDVREEEDVEEFEDDDIDQPPAAPSGPPRWSTFMTRPRRDGPKPTRSSSVAASTLPSFPAAALPAAASSSKAKSASSPIPAALSGPPLVVDGYSFCFVQPPVVTPHLLHLAALTSIPILPRPPRTDFALQHGSYGRSLAIRHGNDALPLIVHWHSSIPLVQRTPLIRALAWGRHQPKSTDGAWRDQPLRGLSILDATTGKGRDAYHIACAGAEVYACERHPALYALLSHSHQRIMADTRAAKLLPRAQRIHLLYADALTLLPLLPTADAPLPDVVYIDTVSAEHGLTTSLESKQRGKIERLLAVRGLKDEDAKGERRTRGERLQEASREEQRLLEVARRVGKRVVVKRAVTPSPVEGVASGEGMLASFRSAEYRFLVFAGTEGGPSPIAQGDDRADPVLNQEMQTAESTRDS